MATFTGRPSCDVVLPTRTRAQHRHSRFISLLCAAMLAVGLGAVSAVAAPGGQPRTDTSLSSGQSALGGQVETATNGRGGVSWVGTWTASPQGGGPGQDRPSLTNRTLRQI